MKLSLLKFVACDFLCASAVDTIVYQYWMIPRLALNAGPSAQKRRLSACDQPSGECLKNAAKPEGSRPMVQKGSGNS